VIPVELARERMAGAAPMEWTVLENGWIVGDHFMLCRIVPEE